MAENEAHREYCRRQHRVLGNYLAMEAWLRALDCIVLVREDLESFLGLQRFRSTRIEWLRKDLKPWFSYQEAYYKTGALSSIHSIFLSRVPIAQHLPWGDMTTAARIDGLSDNAPRTALYATSDVSIPKEAEMLARLAVLAAGLDNPWGQVSDMKKK